MNKFLIINIDKMLEIVREIGNDPALTYASMSDKAVTVKYLSKYMKISRAKVQESIDKLIAHGYVEQINNEEYQVIA